MELILDLYSEVDSFLALRVKLHEEDQQQKQVRGCVWSSFS